MEWTNIIIAIGNGVLALANCVIAYHTTKNVHTSMKTYQRLCERERPRATIDRVYDRSGGSSYLVVSNVGCVPFTVLSIGFDGIDCDFPFADLTGTRCPISINPGDCARFRAYGRGVAFARLASGQMIYEHERGGNKQHEADDAV